MTDPFSVDVHVRYRDLDTMNHVNNAVYATYIEDARVAYVEEVFETDVSEYNFVLANLELSFERSIRMGDEPSVSVEVTALGRSSVTMEHEITVTDDGQDPEPGHRETAATAETTLVFVDPDGRQPVPIPEDVRQRIVEYEGLAPERTSD